VRSIAQGDGDEIKGRRYGIIVFHKFI
jgi:hypothetical protein